MLDTLFFGWGTVIRTQECRSQSPMPYRLAIPQNILNFSHEQVYLPATRYRSLHTDAVTQLKLRTATAVWRYPRIFM